MIGRRTALVALTAGLLFGGLNTAAKAKDTIITFDPPGSTRTWPTSINGQNTIVGSFFDGSQNSHGFARTSDGTITTIDVPGASYTSVNSINNKGAMAGSFVDKTSGNQFCFVRKPDGTFVQFAVAGGGCWAVSINNSGTVTGTGLGSYPACGFVWNKGVVTTFEVLSSPTLPAQINDDGVVTGNYERQRGARRHGFVRAPDGTLTTFDGPGPHSGYTLPLSINASGTITGWYETMKNTFAFVRAPDGTITAFHVPRSAYTEAYAINKSGEIAGVYSDGTAQAGFIVSSDGTSIKKFHGAGGSTWPMAMNDAGVITGVYTDTAYHGFIRLK